MNHSYLQGGRRSELAQRSDADAGGRRAVGVEHFSRAAASPAGDEDFRCQCLPVFDRDDAGDGRGRRGNR